MKKYIFFAILFFTQVAVAQRHCIVQCYEWSYSFPNWSCRIVDADNKGNFPSSVEENDTLYLDFGTDDLQRLVVSGSYTKTGNYIDASGNIIDDFGTPPEGTFGLVCSRDQKLLDLQACPSVLEQSLRKWFYKRTYTPTFSAGGDLAGLYPNPTIAQKSAVEGQVLGWTGSDWQPSRAGLWEYFDDCPGHQTTMSWELQNAGGASGTFTSSDYEDNRPCVSRFTTGTTAAASYRQYSWGNGNMSTAPKAGSLFRTAFKINTLPTDADTVVLKVGFTKRAVLTVTQLGAYLEIRWVPSESAYRVRCVTNNGTATTSTDVTSSFGTLTEVWKTVEIRLLTDSSVGFYLDDTLLTTNSTNVPTDWNYSNDRCHPLLIWGKPGVGAGAALLFFDYAYLRYKTNRL